MTILMGMKPRGWVGALLAVFAGSAAHAELGWDRIANVKSAATQIGEIQAQAGVEQAFKFVSACYKTHGLASAYSKAFEGCVAQDLMLSQTLAEVYERLPSETLQKMKAPSPEEIKHSFQMRAASAFKQYNLTPDDAQALRVIVQTHGLPVFWKIVFPNGPGPAPSQPSPQPKQ